MPHSPAASPRFAFAKPLFLAVLVVLALHGLVACGTAQVISGVQRAQMTEAEIQAQGRATHQEIVKKKLLYGDERLNAYVARLGNRVAQAAQSKAGGANPSLIFRFFVLDDPDTNAFAMPGGYVYVTRGLLALLNNEDELAAVLGHEIAHVADGHALKVSHAAGRAAALGGLGTMGLSVLSVITFNPLLMGLAGTGDTATMIGTGIYEQGYSREIELAADRIGRSYSSLAGYDSGAITRVLLSFQQEAQWAEVRARARGIEPAPVWGVFASHPENKARIDALASSPAVPGVPRPVEADYLASLDGLVFGISDRIGVHRGSTFYSQAHGLSLAVPAGWFVAQSPDEQSVMFFNEKNTARIALVSQDLASRQDARGFAEQFFEGATVAGTLRSTAGQTVWRGTVTPKSMFGLAPGTTYQVMTWTQAERGFALVGTRDSDSPLAEVAWQKHYERVAASFKPLKASELALAQSIKVRLAEPTRKKPLNYAALAKDAPLGSEAEAILRVLNGQYGSKAQPKAGQRVKVLR